MHDLKDGSIMRSHLSSLEVKCNNKADYKVYYIPLKKVNLYGNIVGPIADCCLQYSFEYFGDHLIEADEAIYRFSTTGDITITAVTIRSGDTTIKTKLTSRLQAEKMYESSKVDGNMATMLISETLNAFTLFMTNLPLEQELKVEVSYIELANQEDLDFCLQIPILPPHTGHSIAQERHRDYFFEMDIVINGAAFVECLAYPAEITNLAKRHRVRLTVQGNPVADCILYWQIVQKEQEVNLQVFAHKDVDNEDLYFLAQVNPAAVHYDMSHMPREVLFLVDCSQTLTEGIRREITTTFAAKLLYNLPAQDYFNIGIIADEICWFSQKSAKVSIKNLQKGLQFIANLDIDTNKAELDSALNRVFSSQRVRNTKGENLDRYIVLISDCAAPAQLAKLIYQARHESLKKDRQRINTVFIGNRPSLPIASELGETGGQKVYFLSDNVNEGIIDSVTDSIVTGWRHPVIKGLELRVDQLDVQAAGRQMLYPGDQGWSAIDLGDLCSGHTLWVVGRLHPTGEMVNFCISDADGHDYQCCSLSLQDGSLTVNRSIMTLFSSHRVTALELLRQGGYSCKELDFELKRLGYDINNRIDKLQFIAELMLHEGLQGEVVCAETALCAYRYEKGCVQPITLRFTNELYAASQFTVDKSEDFTNNNLRSPSTGKRLSEEVLFNKNFQNFVGTMNFLAPADAKEGNEQNKKADGSGYYLAFTGVPNFIDNKAIIFDSSNLDSFDIFNSSVVIIGLVLEFSPPVHYEQLNNTYLFFYLKDSSIPRFKICLADIMKHGGKRLLYIAKQADNLLQVILEYHDDFCYLTDVQLKLGFKLAMD